ncbi:response regulator [Acinetobacter rathckeae]|uniref:response regulator n=1 Tax=Acinetobacter rathckeae TaxID=2605272 RepID=UPI0018A32087|nr:response regulator transcription factor [Acinetobacter rathckeae]MBF7688948.1 response regulator transcription factor [Acinetobacter rathckeae]MBF7696347.1 response regulator transcription factor [Acinetobacter rathckeae]
MIKILLIEDDLMISKTTIQLLRHENYHVDWAKTGLEALDCLSKQFYHLVLLDLGLPEYDGIAVLQYLRKTLNLHKTGVIILSARDQTKDKVQGLKLGADDYLVKPFVFDELLARIEVVIRRGTAYSDEEVCFKVGALSMFPQTHRFFDHDTQVILSSKEWAIIEPMMMYPNQIFSRDMLEQKLYDWDDEIQSNTIEVHIYNLRMKLGKHRIRNVRGLGYCLNISNENNQ